jgi:hypothetical protein
MSNVTKVVNLRKSFYDIYIGRPSKWGNPFEIGKDGDRLEVIVKYKDWIQTQQHLLDSLHELDGKILGCFCYPLICHGNILIELINSRFYEKEVDK